MRKLINIVLERRVAKSAKQPNESAYNLSQHRPKQPKDRDYHAHAAWGYNRRSSPQALRLMLQTESIILCGSPTPLTCGAEVKAGP